ncbi:SDR family oxidoreductase, partial [Neisseriaceae bacterium TC5R-5]|nr:SDR family oxidoreductase [Neisseriaceae bacterium TC5R-5]
LVWQAASRGMTAAIYRPGNITGHSQLGTCLPDHNRLLRMVKGSLQMQMMPSGDSTSFDLSPVDYVAQALVGLSLQPKGELIYHLHNPLPLSWTDYCDTLSRLGYRFNWVTPAQWQRQLLQLDESNALFDVVSLYLVESSNESNKESDGDDGHTGVVHWQRTAQALSRIGLSYPVKDSALLEAHFRYLIDCGFLPPIHTTAVEEQNR